MRFLSVCSGMEAASIAFEPLGWKAVGFSEIDSFAAAVLATRFPNTPNYGDLTQHTDPTKWPISAGDVDLIIGGPPCQAFSVAGLRKGLADPRGNLTLTYLSLVDRLRPEWVIYENVPGLLSVDGGRTFGTFLHALGQLGYGWAYRVLDAQHVGECRLHPHRRGWSAVPQRRRRIFVVARRGAGGWASAAEVLSLREGVQRHLAAGGKKRQGVAPDAGGGAEEGGLPRTVGTICADSHPGAYTGQDAYTGRLIPASVCATGEQTHCLTASSSKGATEDGTGRGSPIVIDRAAFNQGENAQYDPHIGEADVMDTVVARGPHAVGVRDAGAIVPIQDGRDIEKRQNGLGVGKPGDPAYTVAPTVTSGPPYSSTGNERVEAEALAITFQPNNLRRQAGAEPSTTTTTTLKASMGYQMPHVATFGPVAIQGTIIGRSENAGPQGVGATEGGPMFTLTKTDVHGVAMQPMAVRRLTPNECLRLQGFPDNWTNIPWKGKPTAPDGPQYKCAGNSFAVPVVRWIGTRIAALTQNETQAQQNNG
jgi:DNA (cytosine-5)-methyltransferase 1